MASPFFFRTCTTLRHSSATIVAKGKMRFSRHIICAPDTTTPALCPNDALTFPPTSLPCTFMHGASLGEFSRRFCPLRRCQDLGRPAFQERDRRHPGTRRS
ncbi:unnamed protein product, partial [Ectocarpus sp. 12 AP-2014]